MIALVLLGACRTPDDPDPTEVPEPVPPIPDTGAPQMVESSPDPCRDLDWDTAGAPFTRTWCATCHSSALAGSRRAGAPPDVDLDTEARVLALADRVRARALAEPPTMPPVVVPPADERAWFAAWLDCAAE